MVLVEEIELLGCDGIGQSVLGEQPVHRFLDPLFGVGHGQVPFVKVGRIGRRVGGDQLAIALGWGCSSECS